MNQTFRLQVSKEIAFYFLNIETLVKVTKDEKKWNEMLAIPNPTQETFPHILR